MTTEPLLAFLGVPNAYHGDKIRNGYLRVGTYVGRMATMYHFHRKNIIGKTSC